MTWLSYLVNAMAANGLALLRNKSSVTMILSQSSPGLSGFSSRRFSPYLITLTIYNTGQRCRSHAELPWIFPGAPLTFNGAPGNIQGNLKALVIGGPQPFTLFETGMSAKSLSHYLIERMAQAVSFSIHQWLGGWFTKPLKPNSNLPRRNQ